MYISPYSIKSGNNELKFKNATSITFTADYIKLGSGESISVNSFNNEPLTITSLGIFDNNITLFPNKNIGQVDSGVSVSATDTILGILPDPPTDIQVVRGEAQITVSFNAPIFTGGSDILNYTVVGNFGDRKVSSTYSPIIVDNLTNGQSYYFQVFATNETGDSVLSLKSRDIIPATNPNTPVIVSTIPGNTFVDLEWNEPWNGGSIITSYNVYVDDKFFQSVSPSINKLRINSLSNGTTYKFNVSAVNDVREGSKSSETFAIPVTFPELPIIESVVPGNTYVDLEWSKPWSGGSVITSYNVYVDNLLLQSVSPFVNKLRITQLSNGTTYKFKVSAVNAVDEGPTSQEVMAIPVTFPENPSLEKPIDANQSVVLKWNEPWSGGTIITSYKIYVDGIFNSQVIYPVNTHTIVDLINGNSYQFSVSAVNAVDEGPKSSEVTGNPSTVPSAPGMTTTPSNQTIKVDWSTPYNGGSPILGYKVYLDNVLYDTVDPELNSKVISQLDNGTTYSVKVLAFNRMGDGNLSLPSFSKPVTVPSAPSISSLSFGNTNIKVVWSAPTNDGGDPIDSYNIYYHKTSSPEQETEIQNIHSDKREYIVDNLENGIEYTFYVSAVDSYVEGAIVYPGEGPKSQPSVCIPATVPDMPIITSAVPFVKKINVKWNKPVWNGGDSVKQYTIYYYSNTNLKYSVNIDSESTEYNIENLLDNTVYTVYISAYNKAGEGNGSQVVLTRTANIPDSPTYLLAIPSDTIVTLNWNDVSGVSNGGDEVIKYNLYQKIEDGSITFMNYVDSSNKSYTVTGLTNGTTYTFYVSSSNNVGEGPKSSGVSSIPRTIPNTPSNFIATPLDSSVSLTWKAVLGTINNGGNEVISYSVYKRISGNSNDSKVIDITVSDINKDIYEYTVPNLINGTSYTFSISANNIAGESSKSSSPSTPRTKPNAPLLLNASVVGDKFVTLSWSAVTGSANGGDNVSSYTIYNGLLLIGSTSSTSYDISQLTNGTEYTFYVSANNAAGESAKSSVTCIPLTIPNHPSEILAVPDNTIVTVTWKAVLGKINNGGNEVKSYTLYQRKFGDVSDTMVDTIYVTDISKVSYDYAVRYLINGNKYTFAVTANNDAGSSDKAVTYNSYIPRTVPDSPTNLSSIPSDQKVSLSWTAPSWNGGASIEYYIINIYQGNSSQSINTSSISTTYDITSLSNGTEYRFTVSAYNIAGLGNSSLDTSSTPYTSPNIPSNITGPSGSNGSIYLTWSSPSYNGGKDITKYSIYKRLSNEASTSDSFVMDVDANTTSYTVTGLTNGTSYTLSITASNNTNSTSSKTSVTAIPSTKPDAPTGLTGPSGYDKSVSLSWTAPLSNGGDAITSYKIYSSSGNTYTTTSTSYNVTGLTNGTSYSFQVSALNNSVLKEGDKSSELTAIPSTKPDEPTGLIGPSGYDKSVSLSWNAPLYNGGDAITSYKIYKDSVYLATSTSTSYTVTGLTNGTSYLFQISAINNSVLKEGNKSSSVTSIPSTKPDEPTDLIGPSGYDTSVSLSWTAPLYNGGDAITSYKIYSSSGNTYTTTSTSYTVTGLTNGTSYSFQVSALNNSVLKEGNKSSSVTSIPSTAPTVPIGLSGNSGDQSVSLSWTVPSSDGGSAITSYKIYKDYEFLGTSTSTSYNATGLTNGTTYKFQVSAVNNSVLKEGPKTASISNSSYRVPYQPTNLTGPSGSNTSVSLSWAAPSSDGGSPIISYKIYQNSALIYTTTSTSYTVISLTNGTTYKFYVTANNVGGEGDKSSELTVIPSTKPNEPTGLFGPSGDNTSVSLSWAAPSSDGGSPITSYKIYKDYVFLATSTSTSYIATGLTNGTTYKFQVSALNNGGLREGDKSSELTSTPYTIPSAPTSVTSVYGNTTATLYWAAPYNGGSAITSYSIYDGSTFKGNTTGLSYTVTGLTNGTSYTFTIYTNNAKGQSTGTNSPSVIPYTVPTAPTNVTSISGNGNISVYWGAPTSNGGSAVTSYRVYVPNIPGGVYDTITTSTSATISGLTNGTAYTVYVYANNAAGQSPASSTTQTPYTVPTAPTNVTSTSGNGSISVSWSAPTSNGGSAVISYRVYVPNIPGGVYDGTTTSTSATISGLTNGTAYTVYVYANNAAGQSPASSTTQTPYTKPSAPTITSVVVGDKRVTLYWSPGYNGGSPITHYGIYIDGRFTTTTTGTSTVITSDSRGYTLINGDTYMFQVSAFNEAGQSSQSNYVYGVPKTVPTAPTITSAIAGDRNVTLYWNAPASNGGSFIIRYVIYVDGRTTAMTEGTNNSIVILNKDGLPLNNETTYNFSMSAFNEVGEGGMSNYVSSMPKNPLSPPSAPTITNFTTYDGFLWSFYASWDPPSNGGSAIIDYTVSVYDDAGTLRDEIITSETYCNIFTDPAFGFIYTLYVSARNAVGTGPSATQSNWYYMGGG